MASKEDPQPPQRAFDGGERPKSIDPFGYRFVGRKAAADAIRLRDEVVAVVAWLLRSSRLDAVVESTSLFDHSLGDVSSQRPDKDPYAYALRVGVGGYICKT